MTLTAEDVRASLRRHYGLTSSTLGAEEWALVDELALKAHGWTEARVDTLAIRCWSGRPRGHERIAFEVKVSRADFQRDITSEKWRTWYGLTHRFAFAVPVGLVRFDEIPRECGLVEIHNGRVRWTVDAPRHDAEPLPEPVVVEIFRRLSRNDERRRRASDVDDPVAIIAALREQLRSAEAREMAAKAALDPYKRRLRTLRSFVRRLAGATCGECRQPIKAAPGRSYGWEHVGPRQVGGCFSPWPAEELADLSDPAKAALEDSA